MMLLHAFESRNTPPHLPEEEYLNLIPKANKDTRFIKNLRPITLY